MNIPNLNFEISPIKGFWNAPSKIDWYNSLPQEGIISIIMLAVIIILFFIQSAGETMKVWKANVLLLYFPIGVLWFYYALKVWLFVSFYSDLNVFIGMILGFLAMVLVLSPGLIIMGLIYLKFDKEK